MVSSVLEKLIVYLALGWPLFPCRERHSGRLNADGTPRADAKSPYTLHGFKDASLDPDQWARWAEERPGCAWGSPTTVERTILDIDPRHGGDLTLKSWVAEHGELPPTPLVATGGGGWQYMLRFPFAVPNRSIGPGADLKSVGGYGIVPPSRIYIPEHFRPYSFDVKPWHVPEADAPEWLVAKATAKPTTEKGLRPVSGSTASATGSPWVVLADTPSEPVAPWTVEPDADLRTHPGVPEGQRRVTLCRLVGTHLAKGDSPAAVWVWAEEWASRCQPAFDEWESHVAGLVRRAASVTAPAQHPLPSVPRSSFPVVVPASEEINSEEINSGSGLAVAGVSSGELVSSEGVSSEPVPAARATDAELVSSEGVSSKVVAKPIQITVIDNNGKVAAGSSVCCSAVASQNTLALHSDAYFCVLGATAQAVAPHTEADEAAVLCCLLTAFGSACGFRPHFDHGKRHGANLFIGLSGATASRKGTATGIGKEVVGRADPEWLDRVQHEGFASGEGLIWAVRDPCEKDPVGVPDKRLLVIEEEWAKTFTLGAADKSILTPIIRGCYDRIPIGKKNKGENAYGCREPHVSIIANITPDDLRQALGGRNAVAIANGFLNRFLLVHTEAPHE